MRQPCLSARSFRAVFLLGGLLLTGCAVGPNDGAERGRNFWDFAAIFSHSNEDVIPVDDPSREESDEAAKNSFKEVPLIGRLLAALFATSPANNPKISAHNNLPEDEELAIAAEGKKYRVPLRLAQRTETHLLDDRKAPLLKVFHVKNGRLHAFSSHITIRGIAEDANGITSLKINGRPIRLRARIFSKKIRVPLGIHQTLIEAEDSAGNIAYFQFKVVRKSARQNATLNRPGRDSIDIRPIKKITPPPRLTAMREPGVYMVLMAGSAAAHIVKMPNLKKCREAVQFSNHAACTYHAGISSPG